jgi:hypothetical protein
VTQTSPHPAPDPVPGSPGQALVPAGTLSPNQIVSTPGVCFPKRFFYDFYYRVIPKPFLGTNQGSPGQRIPGPSCGPSPNPLVSIHTSEIHVNVNIHIHGQPTTATETEPTGPMTEPTVVEVPKIFFFENWFSSCKENPSLPGTKFHIFAISVLSWVSKFFSTLLFTSFHLHLFLGLASG